jgi:hypothetical protein
MMRKSNELETVKWRDELKSGSGKKGKGRQIHFHELSHAQKKFVSTEIARKPIRYTAVLTNKKDDIRVGVYREKNQLYFYMTRYVIERISWFCRDMRPKVPEGDGRVKITFSRRGGLSYDGFKEYLHHLRTIDTRIHWPVIDIDGIDAQDHSRVAALQIADCGARAITEAFEPDSFGNIEPTYLHALSDVIYCRGQNYLSYGLKNLPGWDKATLTTEQAKALQPFE